MTRIVATREHEIACGHRVYGHESKCANLHGHNYLFTFELEGTLDDLGRVLDFSVIKSALCEWLESHWDHRFLVWEEDPLALELRMLDTTVVVLSFNPTAENMAKYMLEVIGPRQLLHMGASLTRVTIHETRKCAAGAMRTEQE